MTLSRRAFLGSIALPLLPGTALFPGAAFGQGLTSPGTGFTALLHQIGGLPGIPPLLLSAAGREFETVYGPRAATALVASLDRGPLTEGLARADETVREQVRFLARLLYTGEVTRDGQTQALYYPWCLAWRSLSFATAPGLCEGPEFGHWSDAPAGVSAI